MIELREILDATDVINAYYESHDWARKMLCVKLKQFHPAINRCMECNSNSIHLFFFWKCFFWEYAPYICSWGYAPYICYVLRVKEHSIHLLYINNTNTLHTSVIYWVSRSTPYICYIFSVKEHSIHLLYIESEIALHTSVTYWKWNNTPYIC